MEWGLSYIYLHRRVRRKATRDGRQLHILFQSISYGISRAMPRVSRGLAMPTRLLLSVLMCAAAALAAPSEPTAESPAPGVQPLRLAAPLPSLEQFGATGLPDAATSYHLPVGVGEAARIAALEAEATPDPAAPYIVGGLGSYRGEHPFMAGLVISLTSGVTSVCGGSLILPNRVLTAASCYWDGASQAYAMLVVLGSVTLFSGGTREFASTITVHGQYSPATIHYDIALLSISYQPTTSYVKPIALASSGLHEGTRAEVIGFGRTSDTAPITTSASMRDVFVSVISNSVCQQYYGSQVSTAEMCTSGVGGLNPCGGDQGGPLIIYSSAGNDLLLGVYTWGSTSGCSAGAPAGYQRVAYYYNWIVNNV